MVIGEQASQVADCSSFYNISPDHSNGPGPLLAQASDKSGDGCENRQAQGDIPLEEEWRRFTEDLGADIWVVQFRKARPTQRRDNRADCRKGPGLPAADEKTAER